MTELTHVELEWVKPDRKLDPLRPERGPTYRRQPEACRFIRAWHRLCVHPVGSQRLRNHVSRIDILRAVGPGESFSTVLYVRPRGESLLHLFSWRKVEKVLQAIDAVEAVDIDLRASRLRTGVMSTAACPSYEIRPKE